MKKAFGIFLFFLVLVVSTNMLFFLFKKVKIHVPECEEISVMDSLTHDYFHSRSWFDLSGKFHCADYCAEASRYARSVRDRNHLLAPDRNQQYSEYWGNIYQQLVEANKDYLKDVGDSLKFIAVAKKMNRTEIAEMLVSFIQDIPYSYIQNKKCDKTQTLGRPCMDGIQYGIIAPYEFIYTLQGDCDTRSVLLHILLKEFGYSSLIMLSRQYRHALIAVDMPSSGDYIAYRSKKYYFWETTGPGWRAGMLPPEMNNIKYWQIALAYEL